MKGVSEKRKLTKILYGGHREVANQTRPVGDRKRGRAGATQPEAQFWVSELKIKKNKGEEREDIDSTHQNQRGGRLRKTFNTKGRRRAERTDEKLFRLS